MMPAEREALASLLAAARREGRQIVALPEALVPADAEEAYAAAALVAAQLGWAPLGWKVAGTTEEMRRRLRMPEPIFGRSFAQFLHRAPARLRHATLLDPIVEAEFFFLLARDLPPRDTPWTAEEVAAAVAAVHAGIEVAECRFPGTALPPFSAILADGSGAGHYVLGPEIADWRGATLPAMPVVVEVDGVVRRRGSGAEVMGDPLLSLTWLANRLPRAGAHLRAGEWISTGTASGMLAPRAGAQVVARFGDLPGFGISFEAA
ncbi:2-keto-4-pentenoate hydratase [Siccirubricoccus sp. G192]|uniref:2-keto-4-pentenoate hydratase n=1 Tax=Siccirubricoccus sp. G192 TaxID=2849651 RepID=UPI001C2C2DDB|nr:fumarylacetoacetate hydrolase family protein [Siccirubricoccus sp. G192]MBV1796048.1 hypothetical protein [Siccirubricoccus sp. G192]